MDEKTYDTTNTSETKTAVPAENCSQEYYEYLRKRVRESPLLMPAP